MIEEQFPSKKRVISAKETRHQLRNIKQQEESIQEYYKRVDYYFKLLGEKDMFSTNFELYVISNIIENFVEKLANNKLRIKMHYKYLAVTPIEELSLLEICSTAERLLVGILAKERFQRKIEKQRVLEALQSGDFGAAWSLIQKQQKHHEFDNQYTTQFQPQKPPQSPATSIASKNLSSSFVASNTSKNAKELVEKLVASAPWPSTAAIVGEQTLSCSMSIEISIFDTYTIGLASSTSESTMISIQEHVPSAQAPESCSSSLVAEIPASELPFSAQGTSDCTTESVEELVFSAPSLSTTIVGEQFYSSCSSVFTIDVSTSFASNTFDYTEESIEKLVSFASVTSLEDTAVAPVLSPLDSIGSLDLEFSSFETSTCSQIYVTASVLFALDIIGSLDLDFSSFDIDFGPMISPRKKVGLSPFMSMKLRQNHSVRPSISNITTTKTDISPITISVRSASRFVSVDIFYCYEDLLSSDTMITNQSFAPVLSPSVLSQKKLDLNTVTATVSLAFNYIYGLVSAIH